MRTTITNRMMIGASLLMMTFSFAINANAETCTQVPTCAELGYTETTCGNNAALKCPFDQTKLFCGNEKCPAGYIYYSDNTCSLTYSSSKTVVGVVAGPGVIVNIDQSSSTMTWEQAIDVCKGERRGGKTAHLPTIEEGMKIAQNSDAINSGLLKIRGTTQLTVAWYWSSTQLNDASVLIFNPLSGVPKDYAPPSDHDYVRCVFDF